jgi:general stress protein 26
MRNGRTSNSSGNTQADIKKLGELIKDIRIAMFTTVDEEGVLHSRPMATQAVEFDGDLWFFTSQQTGKVGDITHYKQVNVAYASTGDERYVSVMGSADLVNDVFKMKELWKPIMKAWFPEGLDDPDLRLIRVNVEQAEYWDTPGGKVGSLLGIVKNLVTGQTGNDGKNEKIKLQDA